MCAFMGLNYLPATYDDDNKIGSLQILNTPENFGKISERIATKCISIIQQFCDDSFTYPGSPFKWKNFILSLFDDGGLDRDEMNDAIVFLSAAMSDRELITLDLLRGNFHRLGIACIGTVLAQKLLVAENLLRNLKYNPDKRDVECIEKLLKMLQESSPDPSESNDSDDKSVGSSEDEEEFSETSVTHSESNSDGQKRKFGKFAVHSRQNSIFFRLL